YLADNALGPGRPERSRERDRGAAAQARTPFRFSVYAVGVIQGPRGPLGPGMRQPAFASVHSIPRKLLPMFLDRRVARGVVGVFRDREEESLGTSEKDTSY